VDSDHLSRACLPGAKIVLGGYHATLAHAELTAGTKAPFDYLIRDEGEQAFPALTKALSGGREFGSVPGLSWLREGSKN
jgi:anaerobic magnesium-protoporphyrin IX monomethyl ester cyclase